VKVIQNSLTIPLLPESEMNVIKSLFTGNQMDYTQYQFYQLNKDELGFGHVRCHQFVNNLKVFSEDLIFHFNQHDTYYLSSGNVIKTIELDTKPSMNQNNVAEIFIQKIAAEKAPVVDKNILKGCFEIEFGYVGLDSSNKKFTKAWKVKPTDRDFPYAYINDENSDIMYYDTGVRF
jgi:Zn-dependent metalloprotease